jgi:hypothetical protein
MRFWFVCFVLLFGFAELFQWLEQFSLPMPIFVLGGVFLAIASNYNKLKYLPFHPEHEEQVAFGEQPFEPMKSASTWAEPTASQPSSSQSHKSISFTIRKPDQSVN